MTALGRKQTPCASAALDTKGGKREFAAIAKLMGTYSESGPPIGSETALL
jgi:hypothetical protein